MDKSTIKNRIKPLTQVCLLAALIIMIATGFVWRESWNWTDILQLGAIFICAGAIVYVVAVGMGRNSSDELAARTAAELRESERSKAVLLSNLQGMAYRCNFDRDWTMRFVSQGCMELTGYSPEMLLNNRDITFNDLISEEYRELLWNRWLERAKDRKVFRAEYEIITASGESY
jgi:PAS domain-containing protein